MSFRPTATPQTLQARANLLRQTRSFFDSRGFVEVSTPLLSADTVIDEHLDPVPVFLPDDAFDLQVGKNLYLQTSPEFHMKRLLASGMQAIYQITHAFRIGESGEQHNPEFTMLEWYRCGDDMQAGMQLLSDFASQLLNRSPATMKAITEVFSSTSGFHPFGESAADLRRRCQAASITVPESIAEDDWDAYFELLFAHLVQPNLGSPTPVIVYDYPASQAALAQTRSESNVTLAERFELFVDGMELANGYHELVDADELMHRNERINAKRQRQGKLTLPENSRLLSAMRSGLPACSGVAVGFDRLVMVSLGLKSIRDVLSFPVDRA